MHLTPPQIPKFMCLNSIVQQSCCSSTPAKSRARNLIFLMLRVKLFMLEVEHPPSTTPSHYDVFTSFPVHNIIDLPIWFGETRCLLKSLSLSRCRSKRSTSMTSRCIENGGRSQWNFPLAFAGRVSQHLKIVSNLSGFMLKNLRNKLDCKWKLRNMTKLSYV